MDDPFVFLGLFPFCVPTVDSIEELNQQIAESTEDYSGSFAGSAYPLELTLKQAMALFWRTKQINLTADIYQEGTEGDPPVTLPIEHAYSTTQATLSKYNNIFNAQNTLEAIKARICGNPKDLTFEVQYEYYNLFGEIEQSTLYEDTITWFGESASLFGNAALFGSPAFLEETIQSFRCVKVFDGSPEDDPNDPNNYKYYPFIHFDFASYNNLYSTFFPHYQFDREDESGSVTSETGEELSFNIIFGEERKEVKLYEIKVFDSEDGELTDAPTSVEFSDWTIDLWPEI